MKKHVLLICIVLAHAYGYTIKETRPRDLIDEAKQQLEELKRIVQGDILVANDELQNSLTNFLTFADNTFKEGGVDIQQEHEIFFSQIATIKELAHSAGKDISVCTNDREEILSGLAKNYTQEMFYCVSGKDKAVGKITEDAKYIINTSINRVEELEHQLRLCGDSVLCITPLVNEIQLDMVRLPENIKTELEASRNLINILQLSVQECTSVKVAEYSSEANFVVNEILNCANGIIN